MKHEWPIEAEAEVGSRQWIFDTVVRHHRKQQARSTVGGVCYYRRGGLRCFAGALIDDAHYDPDMECYPIRKVICDFSLPPWFCEHAAFIEELQTIHDTDGHWRAGRVEAALATFAARHGLRMPAL